MEKENLYYSPSQQASTARTTMMDDADKEKECDSVQYKRPAPRVSPVEKIGEVVIIFQGLFSA